MTRPDDTDREAGPPVPLREGPSGVLLSDALEVLELRGDPGPYLDLDAVAARAPLARIARAGLREELLAALRLAREGPRSVERRGLVFHDGESECSVDLEVLPVGGPAPGARGFLVLFTAPGPETPPRERGDRFLANLAHELRNPLAPMRNWLTILRRRDTDPLLADRAWQGMDRQLQVLTRLVDDMLDITRIRENKIELRPERVALDAIVSEAMRAIRHRLAAGRHPVSVSVPRESLWVDVDPARITQVVANLIEDAAKRMPGGGRIAITGARSGAEVVLRVSGDGGGHEPAPAPAALDALQDAPSGASGLGIGLGVARRLVELSRGRLEVEWRGADAGTSFAVRLPAAEAPRATGAQPELEPSPPRRVLIVDDNVDWAESLKILLDQRGHQVRMAYTGRDALDLAAVPPMPDAVLLDLGLPDLDGYEVARRLRERAELRDALFVAITGFGDRDARRRSRECGFDHHLVKPVPIEELVRLIERPPP